MQDLPILHSNYSSGATIWGSLHPPVENILLLRHTDIYNHTRVARAGRDVSQPGLEKLGHCKSYIKLRYDSWCGHLKQMGLCLYSWYWKTCRAYKCCWCAGQVLQKAVSESKGQCNEFFDCSCSQQIRNETLWGGTTSQRGWRPFQVSVFHQLTSWPTHQCSGGKILSGRALHNRKRDLQGKIW